VKKAASCKLQAARLKVMEHYEKSSVIERGSRSKGKVKVKNKFTSVKVFGARAREENY
jgi:hypothetical protein